MKLLSALMDSLLRGLKQIGTGLKFTMDKELFTSETYVAYKGRYKDKKATIFKYKGRYAESASEAFPLLKHITDPVLARVLTSQKTGNYFYLVTERVFPIGAASRFFMEFIQRKINRCNEKIQQEHSIRICSLGEDKVMQMEIYYAEDGRPVISGVLPKFVQEIEEYPEKKETIDLLDEKIEKYPQMGRSEHISVYDLLKACAHDLPSEYSRYVAKYMVEYIKNDAEEVEKRIYACKSLLLLEMEVSSVSFLFEVNHPQIRMFSLKALQEKVDITQELIDGIFAEFSDGLLVSDLSVKEETMKTLPLLFGYLSGKQKEKILSGLGAIIKKGKGKEKESVSYLVLENYLEFGEIPSVLYACLGCMVNSGDVMVKKNGLLLVEKLRDSFEIKTLLLEVIPLISTQAIFSEVSEQSVALLCGLSDRARKDIGLLKSGDKWKVPGLPALSKVVPIKITQVPIAEKKKQKVKEEKKKEKKEKKETSWDNEEW
ncbi:hypothetical protein NEFER03_1496 [Nematocida sp. LUAm3]|nr:hypothetical protein NEFER03_1496 [Nematocida sp. LUAm3]KAI5174529.1 hypothetical protein NEFER02_0650 [Nematocida sp. LUAm2]KAI5178065.1 hypothetical protein NEFER01_1247 [Nematocida sp. LUAm1]